MAKPSIRQMSLAELAEHLQGALEGDGSIIIRGAASLPEAQPDQVSFLANARYDKHMDSTRAAAVIVAKDYAGNKTNLIRCSDPYFAFRQAMVLLYGFRRHPFSGVDPSAHVDPSARLGKDVAVAQFVTICADVSVGSGTVIYPGVFIGPGCRIGSDCILYPNAVLYDGCVLGDRVTIHACSVLGEDGFGFATHNGRHEKIPHVGWVEVGDDVEIGANCAIDRASMGATAIGEGTKFSNLIAIGHGSKLGKHCLFVAQSGVAGSTSIGNYCVFAGQSGASGHISIGDNVRVGAKAGVHKDVASNQEVLGVPAVPLARARRVMMIMNQLPELREELKRLGAEVEALKLQPNIQKPAAEAQRTQRDEGELKE